MNDEINPKEQRVTMRDAAAENRLDRRTFLQGVGMVGLAAALPQAVAEAQVAAAQFADVKGADLKTPSGKPLRGLYPIMETPFTPDDKLNTDALAAEVEVAQQGARRGDDLAGVGQWLGDDVGRGAD